MRFRKQHVPQLTTAEVSHAQFKRHCQVQETVKRILPVSLVCESAFVYSAIGQESAYNVMRAYLQIIALNEADGQNWMPILDAALDDPRLGDVDLECHLVPLVLELQRRSLFPEDVATTEEIEAVKANSASLLRQAEVRDS